MCYNEQREKREKGVRQKEKRRKESYAQREKTAVAKHYGIQQQDTVAFGTATAGEKCGGDQSHEPENMAASVEAASQCDSDRVWAGAFRLGDLLFYHTSRVSKLYSGTGECTCGQ